MKIMNCLKKNLFFFAMYILALIMLSFTNCAKRLASESNIDGLEEITQVECLEHLDCPENNFCNEGRCVFSEPTNRDYFFGVEETSQDLSSFNFESIDEIQSEFLVNNNKKLTLKDKKEIVLFLENTPEGKIIISKIANTIEKKVLNNENLKFEANTKNRPLLSLNLFTDSIYQVRFFAENNNLFPDLIQYLNLEENTDLDSLNLNYPSALIENTFEFDNKFNGLLFYIEGYQNNRISFLSTKNIISNGLWSGKFAKDFELESVDKFNICFEVNGQKICDFISQNQLSVNGVSNNFIIPIEFLNDLIFKEVNLKFVDNNGISFNNYNIFILNNNEEFELAFDNSQIILSNKVNKFYMKSNDLNSSSFFFELCYQNGCLNTFNSEDEIEILIPEFIENSLSINSTGTFSNSEFYFESKKINLSNDPIQITNNENIFFVNDYFHYIGEEFQNFLDLRLTIETSKEGQNLINQISFNEVLNRQSVNVVIFESEFIYGSLSDKNNLDVKDLSLKIYEMVSNKIFLKSTLKTNNFGEFVFIIQDISF